jgi:hypothetical protein
VSLGPEVARSAALALALVSWASEARAGDAISVQAHDCSMRPDELERLVRLELESVIDAAADPSTYAVSIDCAPGALKITIEDPLTKKSLSRSVAPPPADQPEPERIVALGVAQLYRASWLELEADDPPPLAPSGPAPPRAETRAAKEVARRALDGGDPKPKRWSVAIVGGARFRKLEVPVVLPNVEIDATFSPIGRLTWFTLASGVEFATLARRTGSVGAIVAHEALGLGLEPLVAGRWTGFAEIQAGVVVEHLAGQDVAPHYGAKSVSGVGFDASLGLGPSARVGPIRFELLGRIGVVAGAPAGRVAGDREVSIDGAWSAAEARIRWML